MGVEGAQAAERLLEELVLVCRLGSVGEVLCGAVGGIGGLESDIPNVPYCLLTFIPQNFACAPLKQAKIGWKRAEISLIFVTMLIFYQEACFTPNRPKMRGPKYSFGSPLRSRHVKKLGPPGSPQGAKK
eukprot:7140158-Prymnesium_polylepis.1